jgi:hypothetical protein
MSAAEWVEPLRNLVCALALSFLMPPLLFIWFAPDMTRKELTDFVERRWPDCHRPRRWTIQ